MSDTRTVEVLWAVWTSLTAVVLLPVLQCSFAAEWAQDPFYIERTRGRLVVYKRGCGGYASGVFVSESDHGLTSTGFADSMCMHA
ncbi:hypothetical protein C8Q73DRAFT_272425 [Cubamyces lactineus]|nr:hypothetical protein C8Q73DRAFT_272425 [Cubamyces lactineus]